MNTWPPPRAWSDPKYRAWATSTVYRPGGRFSDEKSLRLLVLGTAAVTARVWLPAGIR